MHTGCSAALIIGARITGPLYPLILQMTRTNTRGTGQGTALEECGIRAASLFHSRNADLITTATDGRDAIRSVG
jgi:hypothetical protein